VEEMLKKRGSCIYSLLWDWPD